MGRLLQTMYYLVYSGSLSGPRYPRDIHAPRQEGKAWGLGLCQLPHQLGVNKSLLKEGPRALKSGGGDSRDHPWKLIRAGPVSIESFIPRAMAVSFFFEKQNSYAYRITLTTKSCFRSFRLLPVLPTLGKDHLADL